MLTFSVYSRYDNHWQAIRISKSTLVKLPTYSSSITKYIKIIFSNYSYLKIIFFIKLAVGCSEANIQLKHHQPTLKVCLSFSFFSKAKFTNRHWLPTKSKYRRSTNWNGKNNEEGSENEPSMINDAFFVRWFLNVGKLPWLSKFLESKQKKQISESKEK